VRNVDRFELESCHSTWVFDPEHQRFHRILKGGEADRHEVTTEWRPYYGVEFKEDSEAFVVLLNPAGTRLIQSWRHTQDCGQCGSHLTSQISVVEIDAVLRSEVVAEPGSPVRQPGVLTTRPK
jgi:hypothetical protein